MHACIYVGRSVRTHVRVCIYIYIYIYGGAPKLRGGFRRMKPPVSTGFIPLFPTGFIPLLHGPVSYLLSVTGFKHFSPVFVRFHTSVSDLCFYTGFRPLFLYRFQRYGRKGLKPPRCLGAPPYIYIYIYDRRPKPPYGERGSRKSALVDMMRFFSAGTSRRKSRRNLVTSRSKSTG